MGLPRAAVELAGLLHRGLDNMKPEEADAFMRHLPFLNDTTGIFRGDHEGDYQRHRSFQSLVVPLGINASRRRPRPHQAPHEHLQRRPQSRYSRREGDLADCESTALAQVTPLGRFTMGGDQV